MPRVITACSSGGSGKPADVTGGGARAQPRPGRQSASDGTTTPSDTIILMAASTSMSSSITSSRGSITRKPATTFGLLGTKTQMISRAECVLELRPRWQSRTPSRKTPWRGYSISRTLLEGLAAVGEHDFGELLRAAVDGPHQRNPVQDASPRTCSSRRPIRLAASMPVPNTTTPVSTMPSPGMRKPSRVLRAVGSGIRIQRLVHQVDDQLEDQERDRRSGPRRGVPPRGSAAAVS